MADFLEGTIEKHEAAAEHAGNVINENIALQEKIQEGLNRLEQAISEAKTSIDITSGNIVGSWSALFIHDEFELKDQIQQWESEIDGNRRFLNRAPQIRDELGRHLVECTEKTKSAKVVEDQLQAIQAYSDLKAKLSEGFSDQDLFHLADLQHIIAQFEPEIFEDFLPFVVELKKSYRGESRLLNIPEPNGSDPSSIGVFWRIWEYETYRFDLLSKPFSGEMESVLPKMRTTAHSISGGHLVRDFNDVFFPALQTNNPFNSKIRELR